ncbi:MAG: Fibronectin type III domain protein [Syntrophus sp. PtaU1.Bin208]|nr:MAG: Fibronectin type III domain protein [Syntrophus sp. PtaU1.Bin208]
MAPAHPFPLPSGKSSFFIIVLSSLTLVLFALLSLLMTAAHAAQVTVAWDANADPAVTGYRVHYGTAPGNYTSHVDVGNATSCVISGLLEGLTYYFAATAYDGSGNESDYSASVGYTVPQAPAPGPAPAPSAAAASGGGGGCFIATAAFGSYHAPEVIVLRKFRDRILLASTPGRLFVALYYRVSPPIAAFIGRDELLKRATRLSLKPLIFSLQHRLGVYMGVLALLLGLTGVLCWEQRRILREVRRIQWQR